MPPYGREGCALKLKSRLPPLELTMNIFYIIGVVVVVIVVAGYLGVHL
jgi:hypothetical protein